MTGKADESATNKASGDISRREWLTCVGLAGVAGLAAVPALAEAQAPQRDTLKSLTAAEFDALEAICTRLIPSDGNGPGAAEARAAHYIDRALSDALSSLRPAYVAGLLALNRYSQSTKGAPFARLPAADQDAVLTDMEKSVATGFTPNAAAFFNLVRQHTIEGTFCDPSYGGNANFVGWDLIGYPGIRTAVTADQQRMDVKPSPSHKSAYDFGMFSRNEH
jgi:gluconate 2-dehydrogenase gamma chain